MNKNQGLIGILALGMMIGQSGAIAAEKSKHVCDFMPENNLYLQDNINKLSGGLSQDEFNKRIDQMEKLYGPLFDTHGGAKLVIERNWTDPTVNAYADESGTTWSVAMFGGLARRSEVTPDGFSMVICHEVGHHLGGYPFYSGDWAAAEGQADYFATEACAKLLWGDDKAENAKSRGKVSEFVAKKCDATYANDTAAQNLCYRTALASQSLANLLSALGNEGVPKFETPDTSVVTRTDTAHPAGQCRLDTYWNGALCKKDFDRLYIPGRGGNQQTGNGSNTQAAEQDSNKYMCGGLASAVSGARPACWFKPLTTVSRR